MTIDIAMPGVVWDDYLDPLATGMEAELGLPAPTKRRAGRGFQVIYRDVSAVVADELAEYLTDRAWTLLGQDEAGSTHRRAMQLADTIRREIR